MNDTPCHECNRIQWMIADAYICRRYRELLTLYDEQNKHKSECVIVNGDWYKGLWKNAVVVEAE